MKVSPDPLRSKLIQHLMTSLTATIFLLASISTRAEAVNEWLIFPQVDLSYRNSIDHPISPRERDITPSVDIFYTGGQNEVKWLAELFASEDETHFERLLLGWSPEDDTIIWLGRFHNPLGFWNSLAHHGAYMQTAITRPQIIKYEHYGGPLPNHISGVLAQIDSYTDDGVWTYDFALGYGPELGHHLEAVDLLKPGKTEHDLGGTIRIAYQPEIFSSKKIGLFASKYTIPIKNSIYQEVDQTVLGITGIWGWQTTEMIGAFYYVDNEMKGTNNTSKNSFTFAYIQFDHSLRPAWAAYLRLEQASHEENDPYLQWFPNIREEQAAIGLRHELTFHQALKFEIRDGSHLDDNYTEYNFQWSAFYP